MDWKKEIEKFKKNKPLMAVLIFIAVILLLSNPMLLVIALIVFLAVRHSSGSAKGSTKYTADPTHQNFPSNQNYEKFDDCPDTFCRHKDKGIHHVRRGKEIDPWDRPDIDISKYQHR